MSKRLSHGYRAPNRSQLMFSKRPTNPCSYGFSLNVAGIHTLKSSSGLISSHTNWSQHFLLPSGQLSGKLRQTSLGPSNSYIEASDCGTQKPIDDYGLCFMHVVPGQHSFSSYPGTHSLKTWAHSFPYIVYPVGTHKALSASGPYFKQEELGQQLSDSPKAVAHSSKACMQDSPLIISSGCSSSEESGIQ